MNIYYSEQVLKYKSFVLISIVSEEMTKYEDYHRSHRKDFVLKTSKFFTDRTHLRTQARYLDRTVQISFRKLSWKRTDGHTDRFKSALIFLSIQNKKENLFQITCYAIISLTEQKKTNNFKKCGGETENEKEICSAEFLSIVKTFCIFLYRRKISTYNQASEIFKSWDSIFHPLKTSHNTKLYKEHFAIQSLLISIFIIYFTSNINLSKTKRFCLKNDSQRFYYIDIVVIYKHNQYYWLYSSQAYLKKNSSYKTVFFSVEINISFFSFQKLIMKHRQRSIRLIITEQDSFVHYHRISIIYSSHIHIDFIYSELIMVIISTCVNRVIMDHEASWQKNFLMCVNNHRKCVNINDNRKPSFSSKYFNLYFTFHLVLWQEYQSGPLSLLNDTHDKHLFEHYMEVRKLFSFSSFNVLIYHFSIHYTTNSEFFWQTNFSGTYCQWLCHYFSQWFTNYVIFRYYIFHSSRTMFVLFHTIQTSNHISINYSFIL
eukprot:284818744_1